MHSFITRLNRYQISPQSMSASYTDSSGHVPDRYKIIFFSFPDIGHAHHFQPGGSQVHRQPKPLPCCVVLLICIGTKRRKYFINKGANVLLLRCALFYTSDYYKFINDLLLVALTASIILQSHHSNRSISFLPVNTILRRI